MKIITTASYHGTGSSAVTDYLSEFSNVHSCGDKEYRFAQEVDGISDLEYNVIENNHRLNTSLSIKRFIRLNKRLNGSFLFKDYSKVFGNGFIEKTFEYVKNITKLKAKSFTTQDYYNHGSIVNIIDRIFNRIMKTLTPSNPFHSAKRYSLFMNNTYGYFTYLSREEFLKHTTNYTDALFELINNDRKEYLLMDQLVPPSNINRYSNYFSNIKVVVVDRDPRDLYIQEKLAHWNNVPVGNVEEFCEWYKITRKHRKCEPIPKNALFIQFEDLIYNYEKTSILLNNFIGLDEINHENKRVYFNPNISIKNTKLFDKYTFLENDVNYIEHELKEFLYCFKE